MQQGDEVERKEQKIFRRVMNKNIFLFVLPYKENRVWKKQKPVTSLDSMKNGQTRLVDKKKQWVIKKSKLFYLSTL